MTQLATRSALAGLRLTLTATVLCAALACGAPDGPAETAAVEPAATEPAAAPPAGDPAAPAELVNTVKWSTASEVDNFGFDVYRGDSEDGPFERLTAEPIAGAGTTDEPTAYQFVDDTIDPHRAYFYYVEAISLSNQRSRFTPVFRAPPKLDENDQPIDNPRRTVVGVKPTIVPQPAPEGDSEGDGGGG